MRPRWLLVSCLAFVVPACVTGTTPSTSSGPVAVVAAEDVWGSIAAQLGGDRAAVDSLVTNPDTDPHDYEPTAADARAVASARLVITNGIGYDRWAEKLIDASPSTHRSVLNVGDLIGRRPGDNPHQWYSPPVVTRVVDAITERYKRLDPAHAAEFDRLHDRFVTVALRRYRATIAAIRSGFAGTTVGASESMFFPLADALGLRLITPTGFLNAISEGNEPTTADKATVDAQLSSRAVAVFVANSQNATPDVRRLVDKARANRIPVITMTETVTPRGASFQDWQTRQLEQLQAALTKARGT